MRGCGVVHVAEPSQESLVKGLEIGKRGTGALRVEDDILSCPLLGVLVQEIESYEKLDTEGPNYRPIVLKVFFALGDEEFSSLRCRAIISLRD